MRLLLVNPRVPPSVWSMSDVERVMGARGMMPSLALTTLAALTPDDVEVTLVDEAEGPVDLDTPCDMVGLTGYITQHRALELADAFRERGRFVVIGGPCASLDPEAHRPHCDVLFIGEAEQTWPQFLPTTPPGRGPTPTSASASTWPARRCPATTSSSSAASRWAASRPVGVAPSSASSATSSSTWTVASGTSNPSRSSPSWRPCTSRATGTSSSATRT